MAGTEAGGRQASQTIKKKYGPDFYVLIGGDGGRKSRGGGFAAMPREKVQAAGRKGGSASKHGPMTEAERQRRYA